MPEDSNSRSDPPFGPGCFVLKLLLLLSAVPTVRSSDVLLPVGLLGCHTVVCHLSVSEEHRLGMFENRVLVKIFGRKGQEVTGNWRQLHSATHHDLYCNLNVIRVVKLWRTRWVGHVARVGRREMHTGF